jgi:cell division protein ZipA
MPELRIILLVVGVLFVAGIAGFEWWRSRGQRPAAVASRGGARSEDRGNPRGDDRAPRRFEDRDAVAPDPARTDTRQESRAELKPLPEINVVREPSVQIPEALPVIELTSTSESGTRRALGISISEEVAVDASPGGHAEPARREPYIGQDDEVSESRILDDSAAAVAAPKLSLQWPSESERRIVTLRVIPKSEPRFAGRGLRQAFSGCGFWHGPLDIYHLPDEQGRVLISAAALAQPGTFDPSIMDSQRFSGLNLFAVLPGPLPEREAFDELVHAARQLAERLDGLITDQHGEELTAARITRLRDSLAGDSAAPPAGHG